MRDDSTLRGINNELNRAENALQLLLNKLSGLHIVLEQMESNLRLRDLSTTGKYILGSSDTIICALTADIRGDPLNSALEGVRGQGLRLPGIIKGSDRSESSASCDALIRLIKIHMQENKVRLIVNLRWSTLPRTIETERTIVVGTRYILADKESLSNILSRLKERGFEVLEDRGEFGGGLLMYKLNKLTKQMQNIIVLEMTLSSGLVRNIPKVTEILQVLVDL